MSVAETRAFGAGLFLLVDALFFGAVLYICAYAGIAAETDAPASATLPMLAAGALLLTWLLHRARYRLLLPFAGAAVTLVLLAFFLAEVAARGLTPGSGRYGLLLYGVTIAWAGHVFAALVALGVHVVRRKAARETPLLGRFLLLQALVGVAILVALFPL
ncbi:MAG: hypothetical protein ACYTEZ_01440 [Planctomycetota bacterium]